MKKLIFLTGVILAVFSACSEKKGEPIPIMEAGQVEWTEVDSIDVAGFNSDLEPGILTMDVGIYFPSNLDEAFDKVTLYQIMESLRAAKEIYAPVDVQINLLWVKTGEIDPSYLAIQANEVPGIPNTEYANLYEHSYRNPAKLTEETKQAFESIIEPTLNNDRTIYLLILQDVFYPFLTVSEGRNWIMKTVRTGGLSFPTYSYPGTISPE